MLPFYGTINSFMGAIGVPTTAFLLPAIAYNWHFRTRKSREAAQSKPPGHAAAHSKPHRAAQHCKCWKCYVSVTLWCRI